MLRTLRYRFCRYLVCPIIGHSKDEQMVPFFQSWHGGVNRGTLHCMRCWKMVGEYGMDLGKPADWLTHDSPKGN